MLLRHSGLYVLARGIPGVVNLLTIIIFSRLLRPEGYGYYALVVAGAGFGAAVLFGWLRHSVLRFLPAYRDEPEELLAPMLSGYLIGAALTVAVGVAAMFVTQDAFSRQLLGLTALIICADGWFRVNKGVTRSWLEPGRYGYMLGAKSVVALAAGCGLIVIGFGPIGALLGYFLGLLAGPLMFSRGWWTEIQPESFEMESHGYLLTYGAPLAVNYVLLWVVSSSDRFLLGWMVSASATGEYAVGYDLAQMPLSVLVSIVNLAAYPLIVEALEQRGPAASREQLRKNEALILAVALPAAAGLVVLTPIITKVFLGSEFQAGANRIMPLIAIGALLYGIKTYHFDLAFHLGDDTKLVVGSSLAAGATNVILNLVLIPELGSLGAAYSTITAYGVGVLVSAYLGRSAFRIPWEWSPVLKVGSATLIMVSVLALTGSGHGLWALGRQIMLGVFIYGVLVIMLDIAELRTPVARMLRRVWK